MVQIDYITVKLSLKQDLKNKFYFQLQFVFGLTSETRWSVVVAIFNPWRESLCFSLTLLFISFHFISFRFVGKSSTTLFGQTSLQGRRTFVRSFAFSMKRVEMNRGWVVNRLHNSQDVVVRLITGLITIWVFLGASSFFSQWFEGGPLGWWGWGWVIHIMRSGKTWRLP